MFLLYLCSAYNIVIMENLKGKGLVDYCDSTECSDDDDQREYTLADQSSSDDDGVQFGDEGNCLGEKEVIESNVEGDYTKLSYER